ncbi:UDP-glucose 4-epimerase GalE [Phenylobacterium montanum]|uniref:UDP-glucose 4-epimerase n=1 Tax=Phenylobacterium montanum TaxID=2823693 RepID=A0A975G693_9CAUL|nr:UDP-glucose 4-epimerase GalE [Caulobacter sp. S6]
MVESILVAGGAGYVGSHACKALDLAGYQPVTLDNLATGHADAVKWGPFVQADIRDAETVRRTVREHNITAVMHFAASSLVGESMVRPELYYENNVIATLRFLEALTAEGIRQIVFSSTAAVYGAAEAELIPETAPLVPTNTYGETKRAIEGALSWMAPVHGFSWAALRYFNAAGADEAAEIGERHDPETHLIPNLVRATLGTGPGLKVFGTDYPTPDGSCVRDYIHVADLADAHLAALAWLRAGPSGQGRPFNLGTGKGLSVLEVVKAGERVLGKTPPHELAGRRAGDPPRLVADPSAAQTAFNWRATRSDAETLIRTAAAFERTRM